MTPWLAAFLVSLLLVYIAAAWEITHLLALRLGRLEFDVFICWYYAFIGLHYARLDRRRPADWFFCPFPCLVFYIGLRGRVSKGRG